MPKVKANILADEKNSVVRPTLKLDQRSCKPKKKFYSKKEVMGVKIHAKENENNIKNLNTKNKPYNKISKTFNKTKQTEKSGLKEKNIENKMSALKNKNTQGIKSQNSKLDIIKEKIAVKSVPYNNGTKFNESEFNSVMTFENIENVISELKKLVSQETAKSKQVFIDFKYILNVTYFNIPRCPKRMVKLKLKHSLLSDDDDVILFVKDLHRGSKVNYELTIQHYENILRKNSVTGIKTIMPFNQLKKEYGSYEMKIKLSNLYEHYLCEGSIIGHVAGFLGKKFQKPSSTVNAVRMNAPDLVKEIEKAKLKTCFKQGQKGSLISIIIGNHKMSPKQVTENILIIVAQLKTVLPGGLPNIRNMYLRINIKGTSSLPIYMSNAQPPIEVPNIIGPKEKKLREVANKANKILTKFHMSEDGKLTPLPLSEIIGRKRNQQKESLASSQCKKMKNEIKTRLENINENEVKNKHKMNKVTTINDNGKKSISEDAETDGKAGESENYSNNRIVENDGESDGVENEDD